MGCKLTWLTTRGGALQLWLRVSSLVRFYKSRFWFFSENFLKNFWIKFLKNLWIQRFSAASHSKMNENWLFFCCFQAVLLLFSNFLRCFSRILTNFKFFSEIFQKIFRIVSEISEKFLKIFWNISEKIMNAEIFCCQRFKNEGKLAVLLLFLNFLRCFSRILTNFRNFSEIFQNFFRNFWKFSDKFLKNFWNISETFLKNLWIQRFSAANHSKMKETSCFAAVFKVFS